MKRLTRPAALFLVLALVLGVACEGFDIETHSAKITVTNSSTNETVVMSVRGDDFTGNPTLGPGGSAVFQTNVGGRYTLYATMTPLQVQDYRNSLQVLKNNTSKVVDGTASTDEKVAWFGRLAEVNAALANLNSIGAAGCAGNVDIKSDTPDVAATIEWVPQLGSGFWQATCASS
jgi:hypothetical protein